MLSSRWSSERCRIRTTMASARRSELELGPPGSVDHDHEEPWQAAGAPASAFAAATFENAAPVPDARAVVVKASDVDRGGRVSVASQTEILSQGDQDLLEQSAILDILAVQEDLNREGGIDLVVDRRHPDGSVRRIIMRSRDVEKEDPFKLIAFYESTDIAAPSRSTALDLQDLAIGEFDTLPDAIVVDIFKVLGPRASWPLRGVSRRFRRLIEETEWAPASLEVLIDNAAVCDALVWLIQEQKLLLGSGSSVSISLKRASERTVEEVCGLLEAISIGQPQTVAIEVLTRALINVDVDKHFLRYLVLGVLQMLQPKEGAASRLENLSICLDTNSQEGEWRDWPSASADELEEALAPFGTLHSLGIFFGQVDAAAVIVAACPNLHSIRLQPKTSDETEENWDELLCGASDILAALAPLACLEHAVLEYPDALTDRMRLDNEEDRVLVNKGLRKLADGAAGKTLRSIYFCLCTSTRPWMIWPCDGDTFSILERMPNLESIGKLELKYPECIRALGRATHLREIDIGLSVSGDPLLPHEQLPALAEVFSSYSMPRLEILRMELDWLSPGYSKQVVDLLQSAGVQRALTELALRIEPTALRDFAGAISSMRRLKSLKLDVTTMILSLDVVEFLRSDVARRALTDFVLNVGTHRPLSEAEAVAIAELTALKFLTISVSAVSPFFLSRGLVPQPVPPYEILRDGLRPDVDVLIDGILGGSVAGLFQGRPRSLTTIRDNFEMLKARERQQEAERERQLERQRAQEAERQRQIEVRRRRRAERRQEEAARAAAKREKKTS